MHPTGHNRMSNPVPLDLTDWRKAHASEHEYKGLVTVVRVWLLRSAALGIVVGAIVVSGGASLRIL